MDKKTMAARIIVFAVIVLGIVVIMKLIVGVSDVSSKYEGFAQCLESKGVKMYGAFWCPHCQAQEAALGMSRQQLEDIGLYVECSNPDRSSTQICIDEKVESYPTWVFPDGTRDSGYDDSNPGARMKELSDKSGCPLPTDTVTPTK